MKEFDKVIDQINQMLLEANKRADEAAMGYDEGFYVGKSEALEEVLSLLEYSNK